jgi:hypothetical protein
MFGVLGPVAAWGADGAALDLKGPRHRAVLARLAVARGRIVPLSVLIEDLWETPPAGAAGAIRTFVGALRRGIEPGRSSRTGFQILVTQGPGYALRRDEIGGEIVTLASQHGLVNFEILGRLIRLQALSGLGDFAEADEQSAVLDQLGEVHERPLVTVFTRWYRAMRTADTADAEASYQQAATLLDHSGMPGVARGLLPLALLCLRVWRREPADFPGDTDWGPYTAWARPWLLRTAGHTAEARQALRRCPEPPPGLLAEALWCLTARAAIALDDQALAAKACDALLPAAAEIAGAGSAMLTAGPVSDYLAELRAGSRSAGSSDKTQFDAGIMR